MPSAPRVLVVDDEPSMRELLGIVLRREGYDVRVAGDGRSAIEALERDPVDLLISDIKMPDMSGVDVLRAAKAADAALPAIMMTAYASTETAVEAMRLGACDYLIKPFDVDELRLKVREKIETRQLRQENVRLKRALAEPHVFGAMLGQSPAMVRVFDAIDSIAATASTVLVTGESGTGKELVARALHDRSLRRDQPFVAINCAALPEALLESELFGHVRGAFTGADSHKQGLFEAADGGTVLLDEIGDMSPPLQVKLLRVLQERTIRRVGGVEERSVDVRVVAATNQDLGALVSAGRFREDLYYRLNVIPIAVPALRERAQDIPLLAEHFRQRFAERSGPTMVAAISGEAMALLERHTWPGNVRELENAIERAVALARTGAILPEDLPAAVRAAAGRREPAEVNLPESGFDLEGHVQELERKYLAEALQRAGGVQVRAAELLGMSFRSFRYYAKKYSLK